MSWSGVLSTVHTHLTTAGASLSPTITLIRRGEPFSSLERQIAYWYDGDQESTTGGNTLTRVNIQERLTIRCYWPVLNRDAQWMSDIEVQVQAANRAIQSALWGDAHLGENAIGLDIGNTQAGWQPVGEAWIRVLTIPVLVDLAETEVIAN